MSKKWRTKIEAKNSLFDMNVRELWEYRDLCLIFVRKNYVTRYKQTILGPLYLILSPLLTSGVFTVVFGSIAGIGTGGIPNFLFYLSGNMAWGFFSASCYDNNNTFGDNAYIMGKVYFPRLIIPISNLFTRMINVIAGFLLLLLIVLLYLARGYALILTWRICLAPLLLLVFGIMGLGIGLIVSSLTIKYRDLNVIMKFLMNLLFYASPVIYPISNLNERLLRYALWNPVAPLLEAFRYVLFGTGMISVPYLIWGVTFTILVFLAGILLFHRVERTFIDTI